MIPLLLWLPALLHLQPSAAALQELNSIIGGSVTFPLNIPDGWPVKSIIWTSNGAIATVIPGALRDPPNIIASTQQYSERLSVSRDYSLTISHLRLEDAGPYRADVNTANTTGTTTTTSQFSLRFYDQLMEPLVMVNSSVSVNGTCIITLTCSVARGGDNVTFSWTPSVREKTVSPNGSVINIFHSSKDPPPNYTCTVTNPVSHSSHTVFANQIFCADTVKELNTGQTTVTVVVTVLVVVGVAVFIGIGFTVNWRQIRTRQGAEAETVEGNTLYAQVQHSHAQREPPHKETTIYSTVQPAKKVESPSLTPLTYEKIM